MPLVVLDDLRLYRDQAYCLTHFNWSAEKEDGGLLLYHCYWAGLLTAHHELSLKSLLVTQSPPFEVWLWMPPEDVERNQDFFRLFEGTTSLRVKAWVPADEASGTLFSGHLDLLSGQDRFGPQEWRRALNASNSARLLLLGKYGGLYFDLDTFFL